MFAQNQIHLVVTVYFRFHLLQVGRWKRCSEKPSDLTAWEIPTDVHQYRIQHRERTERRTTGFFICWDKNCKKKNFTDLSTKNTRLIWTTSAATSHFDKLMKIKSNFLPPNRMAEPSRAEPIRSPSGYTFPASPGHPSIIGGVRGQQGFIKTVCAAWGTQRSLSGLEMARCVYGCLH